MEILLFIICCILLLQLVFVIWNLRQLPNLREVSHSPVNLSISILIPARNEAKRIGDCLESLVKQYSRPLEILVLNDASTDETELVVRQWSEKYPFIRLINGNELPEGWTGKSYACWQLAKESKGDWLLFLDADVRLYEGALDKIHQSANVQKTGMISGFPRQKVFSWLEILVVPMMMFTISNHLPIKWVRNSLDPRFSAAHGGFILIERLCYQEVGGHESIRTQLVEDMELAKLVKKNGFPFTLASITDIAYMRMYTKASEVWSGYRKSIFPGLNRNLGILLCIIFFYFTLYLFPLVILLFVRNNAEVTFLSVTACLIGISIKAWIDFKNEIPLWFGFFTPISVLVILLIGLDSARMSGNKKGYFWKGRHYT